MDRSAVYLWQRLNLIRLYRLAVFAAAAGQARQRAVYARPASSALFPKSREDCAYTPQTEGPVEDAFFETGERIKKHAYHYAGNNPIKYTDPDGRTFSWSSEDGVSDENIAKAKAYFENIKNSDTEAGRRLREIEKSDKNVNINVHNGGIDPVTGKTLVDDATPGSDKTMGMLDALGSITTGGDAWINFNPNDNSELLDGTPGDAESTLAHEIGHSYLMIKGKNFIARKNRELDATAVENQYRHFRGTYQRSIYSLGKKWNFNVPQYDYSTGGFRLHGRDYKLRR
jgi:hypothetical protein